jgi:non-specific serine/threonine protein kinase
VLYRYTFGSVVFDEATMDLRVHGRRSDTEPQPLRVLAMLLRAEGSLVSTSDLIGFLTTEYALAKSMSRLRAALQDAGKYVLAVRGKGYRFDFARAPVVRTVSGPVTVSALALEPGQPVPERGGLVLERQLGGQPPGIEAWVARRSSGGGRRVFRFATDSTGISDLKRELVLSRLLAAELGPRPDILQLHESSLEKAPFFVASGHGSLELAAGEAIDGPRSFESCNTEDVSRACGAADGSFSRVDHLLERLQEAAARDLLSISDEQLLREAARDGDDIGARVSTLRSRVSEALQEIAPTSGHESSAEHLTQIPDGQPRVRERCSPASDTDPAMRRGGCLSAEVGQASGDSLDSDIMSLELAEVRSLAVVDEGWSLDKVEAVELEYRCFLQCIRDFPDEGITPSMDCERFWRCHVLCRDLYHWQTTRLFGRPLEHPARSLSCRSGVRGRALVIATSQYRDPRLSALASPAADAAGLQGVLADRRIGNFAVTTCQDSPLQSWLAYLQEFFRDTSADEPLLLYISGHAVKDQDGELYFAATDTCLDRLVATGLPASFIHEVSENSAARSVLMIFDTCFSGAFASRFQASGERRAINANEYFPRSGGRVVITASEAMQYALADGSPHALARPSFFTRHVIEGLRTGQADIDGDGQISSEDLFRYVKGRMSAEAGTQQRPGRWAFGLDRDLIVASGPVFRGGRLRSRVIQPNEYDFNQELAGWAAEHLRGMGPAERLDLFLQVAQTVRDLHRVGVVLNDIQPGNILVARESQGWRVCFASFGRCCLLNSERLKRHEIDTLGLTPAQLLRTDASPVAGPHIAPELRAGAPASQCSDVYALGVLLYQLLSGDVHKAPDPGWQRDIQEELLHEDISGATDGNPAFRTARVEDLIDALRSLESRRSQRDLETLTQTAEASAQLHRARASARRPWIFAALGVLVLASAGVGVHTYRARNAQKQEEHLVVLTKDVPVLANPVAPAAAREASAREALTTAELTTLPAKDPVTRASQLLSFADAYFGLSAYARADELQRQAVSLLEAARGADDDSTLNAEYSRVRTLFMLSRYQDATALLTRADSHAGARLGAMTHLAMVALWVRAGNELMQSRPDRALPLYEQAEQIRIRVAADDPLWLFRSHANLASCYVRLNRSRDAVALLEPLLRSDYDPGRLNPVDWIKTRLQYGLALSNVARFAQAEQVLRDTVGESSREVGRDNYVTALAWEHLAGLYEAEGRWKLALSAEQHAYPILEATAGRLWQPTLVVSSNLGALEYLSGDPDGAIKTLRAVHRDLAAVAGQRAPLVQLADYYLAAALNETGSAEEAWSLAAALDPTALAAADASGHWSERLQALRGLIQVNRGQVQQGRVLVQKAIAALRRERVQSWILEQLERGLRSTSSHRQESEELILFRHSPIQGRSA